MDKPRNFKLLEELDDCSKYNGVSYGLKRDDDIELKDWTCMVIDSKGMYSNFEINCSSSYPTKAPTVKLVETPRGAIKSLFSGGKMKSSADPMKNWGRTYKSMSDILLYLQKVSLQG